MRLEPNILLIALPLCFIFFWSFSFSSFYAFVPCLFNRLWARSFFLPCSGFFFFFWQLIFFVVAMDAPQGLGYPDVYVPWSLCLCRQQRHILTGWAWSTSCRQVVHWLRWPKDPHNLCALFLCSCGTNSVTLQASFIILHCVVYELKISAFARSIVFGGGYLFVSNVPLSLFSFVFW